MNALKSVLFHWRINLAVMLGAAITTAVLVGALLVGDSVRGSLKDLMLARLGSIDHAMVAERFFREDLAIDLNKNEAFNENFSRSETAILLRGSAINATSKARASGISIVGISDSFLDFYKVDSKNKEE